MGECHKHRFCYLSTALGDSCVEKRWVVDDRRENIDNKLTGVFVCDACCIRMTQRFQEVHKDQIGFRRIREANEPRDDPTIVPLRQAGKYCFAARANLTPIRDKVSISLSDELA